MKRDISLLRRHVFDAVVIGGGIYGATLFHRLAVAGVRALLIEKNDFSSGTSANSLKILHGGLRYLQQLDLKRIRESVRSRKYFMQMAPHLIRPMACIMPTYSFRLKGRPLLAAALVAFDLISRDRNQGAPAINRTGRGRILSSGECLEIVPGLDTQGLTGAALWYDDLILNTERMTLAFIKSATRHNGVCANYLKAGKIVIIDHRVKGVEVTDQLDGRTYLLRAPLVINAAGPWTRELQLNSGQPPTSAGLVKSVNIVVDKILFPGFGVGLAGSGAHGDREGGCHRRQRLFFFVPWQGKTIIGTINRHVGGPDVDVTCGTGDIDELLSEVNVLYPSARLRREHVIFSHAGCVPGRARRSWDGGRSAPQVLRHSRIIDHSRRDGITGLVTIEGVKYTTAPAIARDVVRLLRRRGDLPEIGSDFMEPLSRASSGPVADQELIRRFAHRFAHLESLYGNDCGAIFRIMAANEEATQYLRISPPLLKAEVIYAVRAEMAVKLSDVVFRRTDCGAMGCPTRSELRTIAETMAVELLWDEATVAREVENVLLHYRQVLNVAADVTF